MKPVKRKRLLKKRFWSLKKLGVLLSVLASASTILQNSSHMMSSLYDKLFPKDNPVTYAQLEALRVHPRWLTEGLTTTDSVKVKVSRSPHPR